MLSNKNGDIVGNYEGKWIDVDCIDGEILKIMDDARREVLMVNYWRSWMIPEENQGKPTYNSYCTSF